MSSERGAKHQPLSRGQRLARDVLYALQIEKRPWSEVAANRRAVVMDTFKQFDTADEFEGMLAAQMATAHSIFLGSSFLAVDKARPDRERAYYLRQAVRLMGLYRQHFSLLRQCRKDRERAKRVAETAQPAPARQQPAPEGPTAGAGQSSAGRQSWGLPVARKGEFELTAVPMTKQHRPRLMYSTALPCAQGP